MADKISVEIGLEGGDDVRKTLEEIVGGVDGLKSAAEELGKTDATVDVKAEGADEAKTSIDGVKTAAEELSQVDATVKVGVEGADEAKAALDGVAGSAGEAKGLLDPLSQTATIIGAGFDGLSLAATRASGQMDSLGVAATKMATRMTRSLGILGVAARALGPVGIALGVLGGAFVKFGDDAADGLNKLTAASAKLDLSVQNFDKLQKALLQAGVSGDAIQPGLEKLKKTLSKEFFQTDLITGFRNIIAELERMPDGAARTSLAMEKLDDSLGAQVIAGLQTGTISANNFAAALGAITPATQQQIVEAAKYQQTLNQLSNAWTEFKAALGGSLTTPLQFLTSELQSLTAGFNGVLATYQTLKASLSEDFSMPWLAKIISFDPNLLASKWLPVLQLIQSALGQGTWPALDALVQKAQTASEALKQTGQAGQQAAQGLQLVTNPFTGMAEVINTTNQALQQTGPAAAQAGQQATQGYASYEATLGRIQAQNQQLASTPPPQPPPAPDVSVWQTLKQGVIDAGTAITDFASKLGTITWDAISGVGVAAWNALTGAIQSAIDKLLQFIGLKPSAPATGGGAPGKAGGGMIGGRGTGTSDSNLAWLSRGEYVMPASAVRQPGVLAFLEALRRSGRIPGFQEGGLSSGPNFPQGGWPFSGFGDEAKQAVQLGKENNQLIRNLDKKVSKGNDDCAQHAKKIEDGIDIFWDALLRSSQGQNTTGVSSGPNFPQGGWPFAAGGLLGGRGTGTSDSNLAWLSRGEHIMPARAVAQPGVLALLEALRRSGGNLRSVLDGMGRFALGGMVPRVMPAFAGGGPVGGMNHVTIQFPGLPAIGGLRASSAVVEELHRAAALAQVRSGGRKPSRYS